MQKEVTALKEQKEHGNFLFPYMAYHTPISHRNEDIPVHWHNEMEFGMIIKGTAYLTMNGEEYELTADDIVIMPPRRIHGYIFSEKCKELVDSRTAVFDLSMLQSANSDSCTIKYFAPLLQGCCTCKPVVKDPVMKKYLLEIYRAFEKKEEGYELEIKAKLMMTIREAFRKKYIIANDNSIQPPQVYESMMVAIDYITLHYNEDISLDDMSKVTGKSKYYLTRNFHKYTGMPCIEYINHYRLTTAANMLRSTNQLVIDIAMEVGFDNISYFNKLFRRKFGVTPKEFRKEILGAK